MRIALVLGVKGLRRKGHFVVEAVLELGCQVIELLEQDGDGALTRRVHVDHPAKVVVAEEAFQDGRGFGHHAALAYVNRTSKPVLSKSRMASRMDLISTVSGLSMTTVMSS